MVNHLEIYFNPRTHRGVRQLDGFLSASSYALFQSTHPSWGATITKARSTFMIDISIHAPIVGCDLKNCEKDYEVEISIHAPIVGCDAIHAVERQHL